MTSNSDGVILVRNTTAQDLQLHQLGDRDYIESGTGRSISGVLLVKGGDAVEITPDEIHLFAGSSIWRVEIHNDQKGNE